MVNKKLVNELTNQTQILKKEYLEQTDIYARKEFAFFEEVKAMTRAQRYDHFGVEYVQKTSASGNYVYVEYIETPKGERCQWGGENYKKSKKVDAKIQTIINTVDRGLQAYLSKKEKMAITHYKSSIDKLAYRISLKKLNEDALVIKTARVGVNIETVLTDGVKTVKAWTIVASGLVQQPHYRYLIK